MVPRNDPVLDSGFAQEDIPRRKRKRFPSFLIWVVPLLCGVGLLLNGPWETVDAFLLPLGLAIVSVPLYVVWTWRTRALDCPRCRRRLRLVGRDEECAYFPCAACRIMWRSAADRMPDMNVDVS